MLATALIVFREVLEAALVVGIVLAASQGVPRRGAWVSGGIALGVLGAAVVAAFAQQIAAAVAGIGQELFNASVVFAAVIMLGWHNVWMGRHGREMAVEATSVGRAVLAGTRPLHALALVAGLAVLREGSELVLFLYSIAASDGGGALAMTAGGLLGIVSGAGVGGALYFGLLRIPMRHLFTVTSALILLLAAGMASQGAAFLLQADVVPALGDQLWDTSFLLRDDGILGRALHALVGYTAAPAGIQAVFYLGTILVIGGLMRYARNEAPGRDRPVERRAAPAVSARPGA
jgi:high-affinity iron transporter